MFKYNSTSQLALYIQHILSTTAIPGCPTANPFNKDYLGMLSTTYMEGAGFRRGKNSFRGWEFGEYIPNLTSTYSGSESYYSTEVHERLGDYLRTYRDYYKIDLMNFYNCYSGRALSSCELFSKELNSQITCFPIKLGAKYLIKIYNKDCRGVTLQPAFAVDGNLLSITAGEGNKVSFKSSKHAASQFVFEMSAENIDSKLWSKQRYLNLFIQVATSDPLRISVIEQTGYYPTVAFNSLLDLDDVDYNVPFSDRLLEYLTGNVITPADPIPQNIERVQKIVASADFGTRYKTSPKTCLPLGRYTEELRSLIYRTFSFYRDPSGEPLRDFLGYVDKDVEKLLWDCLSEDTRKAVLEI